MDVKRGKNFQVIPDFCTSLYM